LWSLHGYNGTGIEELSEATGLKRGALYYHIGSKEALLYDVLESLLSRLLDASGSMPPAGSFEAKLRFLSRVLMRDIAANHAEWAIFHRDLPALTGPRLEKINDLHQDYEAMWKAVLADGSQAGEFDVLSAEEVSGVLGMHYHADAWIGDRPDADADTVSDQFVRIILDGIASTHAPVG